MRPATRWRAAQYEPWREVTASGWVLGEYPWRWDDAPTFGDYNSQYVTRALLTVLVDPDTATESWRKDHDRDQAKPLVPVERTKEGLRSFPGRTLETPYGTVRRDVLALAPHAEAPPLPELPSDWGTIM